MALKIIANTVWGQAAQFKVVDLSDVATADTNPPANVVGGPRHLAYAQSGTGARRFVYVNKSGGMAADTMGLIDAVKHATHSVNVKSWTSYPSTATSHFSSSNWSPTLIGPNSRDAIVSLGTQTSKQAFGLELDSGTGGAYTKIVTKLFFGTAFNLNYNPKSQFSIAPSWGSVLVKRQNYLTDYIASFAVEGITRTEIDTLQGLYKIDEEPFFLYDDTATRLSDSLWYCVLPQLFLVPTYDNMYTANFVVHRLRSYAL